jgi:hypothetical protein
MRVARNSEGAAECRDVSGFMTSAVLAKRYFV